MTDLYLHFHIPYRYKYYKKAYSDPHIGLHTLFPVLLKSINVIKYIEIRDIFYLQSSLTIDICYLM